MSNDEDVKMKDYTTDFLNKNKPTLITKQFTMPLMHKKTGELALCQIKECDEKGAWFVKLKSKESVLLCFGHGEDY